MPIIDVHTHINGPESARVYERAASAYHISLTYSMTQLEQIDAVRDVLGERIRFIATPNYMDKDRRHALGQGYLDRLTSFRAAGARIAKFWAAPRGIDFAREFGDPGFMRLDAPHRLEAMKVAASLGMIFMTHVADPDTWFATKYADALVYGTKRDQYTPLERLLDRFTQPWIAAHMAGWPEDLAFLDGLLSRHGNLYLDTSATKWMVRELSRHSRDELLDFLRQWRGRVMFGSDIVTTDEHLRPSAQTNEQNDKATSAEDAFDLYASRYWALRTMWETDFQGTSPIVDPDLAMVDPRKYGPTDAPPLRGHHLPADVLRDLYHDAAHALLEPLHETRAAPRD